MAYRRSRGKPTKIQPAVMTMAFVTAVVPHNSTAHVTIDLSQCASLVNRRFYRQGINWAVDGIKINASPTLAANPVAAHITSHQLPTTWVMSNSWEKGFRAWQKMIENATDESSAESIKGKFLDFKVYADAIHHTAGFGANLKPISSTGSAFNVGQWQPSEFFIPIAGAAVAAGGTVTNDREILAVGPNLPGAGASGLDAVSLVQGYADSRRLPYSEDPAVPADADTNWLVKLFQSTEQDQDVIDELEQLGDKAPYPFEGDGTFAGTMYPGGETNAPSLQIHDFTSISGTTLGGISYLKGGMFPCGLLRLQLKNENAGAGHDLTFSLTVSLVPGKHRGYLCEPMTDM